MKKADCSYTYININYRLRGSNEYLNRHMEDQKEFDLMRVEFGFKSRIRQGGKKVDYSYMC